MYSSLILSAVSLSETEFAKLQLTVTVRGILWIELTMVS